MTYQHGRLAVTHERGITIEKLVEMLGYMRPSGSRAARAFGRKFLRPVFGKPDAAGNYTLRIGDAPRVMFAAHYDTVHRKGGTQTVQIERSMVTLHKGSKSDCLGADCTTGIWLILRMIEARVPGFYAVFADEEIGCAGSRDFVDNRADELEGIEFVLSFDRKGFGSVITHQSGYRTASDEFAESLEVILGMGFKADSGGSFTDSNEFAHIIPECSNISVGYSNQHTPKESQCLDHAEELAERLIKADWSRLRAARDPGKAESLGGWREMLRADEDRLRRIVRDHPDAVAALLADCGYSEFDILDYVDRGTADDPRGVPYVDFDPDTGLTVRDLFEDFR